MQNKRSLTLILLLSLGIAFGLLACSAGPRQIASYPRQGEEERLIPQPWSRLDSQFVYDAYIDMEVSNPTSAADHAEELAYDYNGYLVSSQSWTEDGSRHTSLVLAVPAPNFEGLRRVLLRLGSLQDERVSGSWSSTYDGDWSAYSHITVTFHPKALVFPDYPSTGWNPANTFASALRVFLAVFGFLADILIWALVVIGPFVLMILGLRALLRRSRPAK